METYTDTGSYCESYERDEFLSKMECRRKKAEEITKKYWDILYPEYSGNDEHKKRPSVIIDNHGLIWSGNKVFINTCDAALQSIDAALVLNRMVIKERWGTYWQDWETGSKWPE